MLIPVATLKVEGKKDICVRTDKPGWVALLDKARAKYNSIDVSHTYMQEDEYLKGELVKGWQLWMEQ